MKIRKSKKNKKQNYEKEHNKIITGFKPAVPIPIAPQWINPGEFIVKFSLYHETPNSISSTNTSVTTVF